MTLCLAFRVRLGEVKSSEVVAKRGTIRCSEVKLLKLGNVKWSGVK